jgi:5-methyltetrahydropteroyltriglutamate--homocysteine methyltransferase
MFRNLNVDGYFMEYDSDRSGDFEPLRFVRNDQIIVLGLISSKVPELESKDEIMRRIEEATRYISIENICLSPQCGFSSTHHGNKLSMDDQKRKLELVVNIAQDIWEDT